MSKRTGGRAPPERPILRLTPRPEEIATKAPLGQAFGQMLPGEPEACKPGPNMQMRWDGSPKMKRIPYGCEDLTGTRFGRLLVKGLLDMSEWPHRRNGRAGVWVVRCDCGMWETRSAKAVKRGEQIPEHERACLDCRTLYWRTREQRRTSYFDKHGRWPEDAMVPLLTAPTAEQMVPLKKEP